MQAPPRSCAVAVAALCAAGAVSAAPSASADAYTLVVTKDLARASGTVTRQCSLAPVPGAGRQRVCTTITYALLEVAARSADPGLRSQWQFKAPGGRWAALGERASTSPDAGAGAYTA